MAESTMAELLPTGNTRFFCHKCTVEFEQATVALTFTCPHCAGGFIEELLEESARVESPEPNVDVSDYDAEDDVMFDYFQTDLSSLLMSVVGGGPPTSDASGSSAQGGSRSQGSRRSSNRTRQHLPFENLLQQFIVNLTSNGVAGAQSATMSGPMMFLAGNPGDYAWGREGLDTIVTQLLNQMDGSGPPPLSQEQIGAVPFVNVSQQQLSTKLQCSVCWEDFILHESVRQLPCTHVYHENCILPWLQLHATCPICRKSLLTGSARDNDVLDTAQTLADMFHSIQSSPQGQPISVETHQETRANSSTGRSFRYIAPPERLDTALDIEQPMPTTTTSSATNPSTGNRNNSDTLFDFNMDLEYD